MVSKLAVGYKQIKAFAGEDVHVCLLLSCGLAHLPLLKTQAVSKMFSRTPTLFVDLGRIRWSLLLGLGMDWPIRVEQLVPSYDAPLYWQESTLKRAP